MKLRAWNFPSDPINEVWEEEATKLSIKNKCFPGGQNAMFVFCVYVQISSTGETESFLHLIIAPWFHDYRTVMMTFCEMMKNQGSVNGEKIFLVEDSHVGWGRVKIIQEDNLSFLSFGNDEEVEKLKWWLGCIEVQLKEQFGASDISFRRPAHVIQ